VKADKAPSRNIIVPAPRGNSLKRGDDDKRALTRDEILHFRRSSEVSVPICDAFVSILANSEMFGTRLERTGPESLTLASSDFVHC
jgi:hypothetical protein